MADIEGGNHCARNCIARNLRDHSCTLRKLFVSLVSYSPLQHVLFFLRKYLIFAEEFLFNFIFLLYLFIYLFFVHRSIDRLKIEDERKGG